MAEAPQPDEDDGDEYLHLLQRSMTFEDNVAGDQQITSECFWDELVRNAASRESSENLHSQSTSEKDEATPSSIETQCFESSTPPPTSHHALSQYIPPSPNLHREPVYRQMSISDTSHRFFSASDDSSDSSDSSSTASILSTEDGEERGSLSNDVSMPIAEANALDEIESSVNEPFGPGSSAWNTADEEEDNLQSILSESVGFSWQDLVTAQSISEDDFDVEIGASASAEPDFVSGRTVEKNISNNVNVNNNCDEEAEVVSFDQPSAESVLDGAGWREPEVRNFASDDDDEFYTNALSSINEPFCPGRSSSSHSTNSDETATTDRIPCTEEVAMSLIDAVEAVSAIDLDPALEDHLDSMHQRVGSLLGVLNARKDSDLSRQRSEAEMEMLTVKDAEEMEMELLALKEDAESQLSALKEFTYDDLIEAMERDAEFEAHTSFEGRDISPIGIDTDPRATLEDLDSLDAGGIPNVRPRRLSNFSICDDSPALPGDELDVGLDDKSFSDEEPFYDGVEEFYDGIDHFSLLPDEVLMKILQYLPLSCLLTTVAMLNRFIFELFVFW